MKSDAKQRRQASSSALLPAHVQIRFLLAGETGVGQVFGCRAAPDRDARVRVAARTQTLVGGQNFIPKRIGEGRGQNRFANFCSTVAQRLEVSCVEPAQKVIDLAVERSSAEETAIRLGRDREPIRHFHALRRKFAEHFA